MYFSLRMTSGDLRCCLMEVLRLELSLCLASTLGGLAAVLALPM